MGGKVHHVAEEENKGERIDLTFRIIQSVE